MGRVVAPNNTFLSFYYNELHQRTTAIPAAIVSSMFQLDFTRQLALVHENFKFESQEKLNQIMNTIVASAEVVDDKAIVAELIKQGLKPDRVKHNSTAEKDLLDFVADLKMRAIRASVETGLTGVMIRNVLNERQAEAKIPKITDADITHLKGMIDTTSELFSLLVTGDTGNDIAAALSKKIQANPIISLVKNIQAVLRTSGGAIVPVRESYVVDEFFKTIFDEPYLQVDTVLNAKVYEIKSCIFKDMDFGDYMAGFVWALQTSLGIEVAGEANTIQTTTLNDTVRQIVTGYGESLPYIPAEVGPLNLDLMFREFMKVYMLHVVVRLVRGDGGDYKSRVENSIKTNRFFKLEEMQRDFGLNLNALSVSYEAFKDTAAFMRDMYERNDVLFASSHLRGKDGSLLTEHNRLVLTKHLNDSLARIQTYITSMDHPAYFKQPAHVLNHKNPYIGMEIKDVSYTIHRSDVRAASKIILVKEGEAVMRDSMKLFTTGLKSGSWYDLPDESLAFPRQIMADARVIEPIYSFTEDIQSPILLTKVARHIYNLIPLTTLHNLERTRPDLADLIRRRSQLMTYLGPEDLASDLGIPEELASTLWGPKGRGSREFLDLSGLDGVLYLFEPRIFPYYEIRHSGVDRSISPVLAMYPALDVETISTISTTSKPNFITPESEKKLEDKETKVPKKAEKKEEEAPKSEEDDESEDENTESVK